MSSQISNKSGDAMDIIALQKGQVFASTYTLEAWIKVIHWGRVTHICVSNLTIIGSDNGLSPGRRQAII